jgi:hypothetical protein
MELINIVNYHKYAKISKKIVLTALVPQWKYGDKYC